MGLGVAARPAGAARRAPARGSRRAGRSAARRRRRRGRGRRPRRRSSAPRRPAAPGPRGAPSRRRPSSRVGVDALEHALARLLGRQVAEAAQHVVQGVAFGRARVLGPVLEVRLDLLRARRVDQLAQLLLAEQLAQQVAVERQRGRPALGVGRVALVHVGRDVVEEQRRRERRRGRRLDLDQRQLAAVQPQQLDEARQVEHVAQALAVGLEDDRELAVALGHLEQRLRLQALLPQRRAPARVGAGDQQRARGVLAEARAEQRRWRRARRRRGPRPRRARSAPARRPAARRRRGGGR